MNEQEESTYGDRLRQIRQKLKMSQNDLTAKLNKTGPALSEFENNKYRPGYEFFYMDEKKTIERDFKTFTVKYSILNERKISH
jgi:transcriptional regulator with XRE-family HTH domain